MSAEVVPFKLLATVAPPDNDDHEDCYGPPPGAHAWQCNPCGDNPEVDPTGEFCFYVTADGVHCWTCHATQYFT